MADETDEGIAYLRALKRPSSSQATTAVAPARETDAAAPAGTSLPTAQPGTEARYQGAEKRRSSRYKCQGSAEMQAAGSDVRTWATFTDVSLHGCYVEAQATYPAGTPLHLKLEAKDVRVECAASVRVNYPHLGMGIAFLEMSDENRARLKELLGAISRPAVIMGPGFISLQPDCAPMDAALAVPDPGAAVRALFAFFENRHMLMRDDFFTILTKSQVTTSKG